MPGFPHPFGMGYLVNPYAAYTNGSQLVSTDLVNLLLPPPKKKTFVQALSLTAQGFYDLINLM